MQGSKGSSTSIRFTPDIEAPGWSSGHKLIIVCCDGTWQDGISNKYRWQYSNILKIARCFHAVDDRYNPPVPQVILYQTGIGSENDLYSRIIQGGTGAGLGEKVQEAYAFVAHNFAPGDEIFLFGFSRGAYTARMVSEFIGAIGILDKVDMDSFAEIFLEYQKLGKARTDQDRKQHQTFLKKYTDPNSPGKLRAAQGKKNGFSIKCVGVFDTVGSIGLPGELVKKNKETSLFGFIDTNLGEHVGRALQALALNETRDDFAPAKFMQTDGGRGKGQVLKQCWFSGSHSDVGGGYEYHDLSDLTLTWMLSNVEDILSIDREYLFSLLHPSAPYGRQLPHDSSVGIFQLADIKQRPTPLYNNPITNETVHPSVFEQKLIREDIKALKAKSPGIVWQTLPLEEIVRDDWKKLYVPGKVAPEKTIDPEGSGGQVGLMNASREDGEQRSFLRSAFMQKVVEVWRKVWGLDLVGKAMVIETSRSEAVEGKSFEGVQVSPTRIPTPLANWWATSTPVRRALGVGLTVYVAREVYNGALPVWIGRVKGFVGKFV